MMTRNGNKTAIFKIKIFNYSSSIDQIPLGYLDTLPERHASGYLLGRIFRSFVVPSGILIFLPIYCHGVIEATPFQGQLVVVTEGMKNSIRILSGGK